MSEQERFQPAGNLDDVLQREIEDALGDMSLDDILAAEDGRGQRGPSGLRRGRVIAIDRDDIFVDLGGKSQGVLPARQFEDEPLPKVGDVVEVLVERYDANEGLLILSREGALKVAAWDTLEVGQVVEGVVTGYNKGGLELKINGIAAFMPISQIELFRVENLAPYVQQKLRCRVSEIDRRDERLIVSRRDLLEEEAAVLREQLYQSLSEGKVVKGVVKTVMPYGAFVDIGGVDGLLHVSDMSYKRVEDPREIVQEGKAVEVMVLKVDRENRRISLGLKQVMPDPWTDAELKWPVDAVVTGRITRLADFGAFVELEEGVEGLIPIGEILYGKRISHPREVLHENETVKVRVLSVDPAQRRISLSVKQTEDDPWTGASVRWPADATVEGTVTRVTNFGAFVELSRGVEGLVHISELSDQRVRAVTDVVKPGDVVRARVISVDEEGRRIGLSLKALKAAEAGQYDAQYASTADNSSKSQRPRKKPLRGGLE